MFATRNKDNNNKMPNTMETKTITKENFEQFIGENNKVLIDFYATWCGPCRVLSKTIDQFAEKHADIAVGKCDVEENPDVAEQFGVRNLPFIVYLEKGDLKDARVGLQTMNDLEGMVAEN